MLDHSRTTSHAVADAPALDGNGRLPAAPAHPPNAPHSDEHGVPTDLPRMSGVGIALVFIVLVVLFVALFFAGWLPHTRKLESAARDAAAAAADKPEVETLLPQPAAADATLSLPGDVQANQMTSIYARVSGYLLPLPEGIDIGAKVKAGQVIASISAPELDAQLSQARASAEQARAAVRRAEEEHALAESTLKRYENPNLARAISQQELDVRRSQETTSAAALNEARINVTVADAAVKRLSDLQAFETVTAPFDGVITARGYDVGALISSSDSGGGRAMFVIQDVNPLRVGVSVPQEYATDMRIGTGATLKVSNYPDKSFEGKVARTAGAIDPSTRTLRVQVDVPNPDGSLLPGMYGQVRFKAHRDRPPLMVPTSAIISGPQGEFVALIQNGRIKRQAVSQGRDYGAQIEILEGLAATDQIVKNPGTLADGAEVTVHKP